MNLKALIVAAVFAALGVVSLIVYMKRVQVEATGGEKIEILVVTKEVKRGTIMTEDYLGVREVPMAYVEERVVKVVDKAKVLGVRTERALTPQQTLQWTDMSVSGYEDRFLSTLVQPGSRAFTLSIPANYMSVHLVRPGDYVDLIGVVSEGNTQSSTVLLQKILVLAVNDATLPYETGVGGGQLLTLSLTLQETQTLALALQRGPVMPALRSPEASEIVTNTAPITVVIPKEAIRARPAAPVGPGLPRPL